MSVNERLKVDILGQPSRRLVALGGVAIGAGLGTGLVLPGMSSALAQRRRPAPAEVALEDLMKPGELPDIVIGKADAPVTIVEFASMSCGACAAFHVRELPKLKERYIDTGKVRLIFREYPLNRLAQAVNMLARCAGGDKTYPLIGVFFEKIETWAVNNPLPELFKIAKQAGFTQESFDKCLTDQKLLDQILAYHRHASEKLFINATPTFFVNGKRHLEAPTFEALEKVIKTHLPS
jgi:protein-disulfide isomerase